MNIIYHKYIICDINFLINNGDSVFHFLKYNKHFNRVKLFIFSAFSKIKVIQIS